MRWRGITRRLRWRASRWLRERADRLRLRLLAGAPEDQAHAPDGGREPDQQVSQEGRAAAALLEWRARAAPKPPRHWLEHIEAAGRRFKVTWIHAAAPGAGRVVQDAAAPLAEHRAAHVRQEAPPLNLPTLSVRPPGDKTLATHAARPKVFIRHGPAAAPAPIAAAKIAHQARGSASPAAPQPERSRESPGAQEPIGAGEQSTEVPPSGSTQVRTSDWAGPGSAERPEPWSTVEATWPGATESSNLRTADSDHSDVSHVQESVTETPVHVSVDRQQADPVPSAERSRVRTPTSFSPEWGADRQAARTAPAAAASRRATYSPWPELTATRVEADDALTAPRTQNPEVSPEQPPLSFTALAPRRSRAFPIDTPAPPGYAETIEDVPIAEAVAEPPGRWPTLPERPAAVYEEWRATRHRLERLDRLDREQRGA